MTETPKTTEKPTTEPQKMADVLATMGVKKAQEQVSIKGIVQQTIQETIRLMAKESGVSEEQIVGIAVTDWVRKAQRRIAQAQEPLKPRKTVEKKPQTEAQSEPEGEEGGQQ